MWRGYTTGTNTVTSEIFANGAATFADSVKVNGTEIQLLSDGRIYGGTIYGEDGSNSNGLLFQGNASGAEKFKVDTSGAATFSGTVTDSKGDVRSIPANTQSGAYTAVAADAGKAIYISTGGVTINASVFAEGDAVTIINNSKGDQTITKGSGVTMYNADDAATGNRTLAQRGVATLWFAADTKCYISGAVLS